MSNETESMRASGFHNHRRMPAAEVVGAWWGAISPGMAKDVQAEGACDCAWVCERARVCVYDGRRAIETFKCFQPHAWVTPVESNAAVYSVRYSVRYSASALE